MYFMPSKCIVPDGRLARVMLFEDQVLEYKQK